MGVPIFVGAQGIGEAIARCNVPRKDLFLISKVWNTTVYKGEAAIREAVQTTLKALRKFKPALGSDDFR